MRNNTITAFLAIAVMAATIAQGTPEQDRLWSTRVTCELQTAGAQSLPTLTFSQGSTPLLSLDQYRAGKSVNADSNIIARLVFGPTQTNQYYVAVTNYAVSGNGYLIQCPTIGTNTTAGAWWYTAYFESATGHRYWTGNGRMNIISTTSTADGLSWQEFVSGDSITPDELAAALLAYEPVLPSTPTNPASKYLNGNREWTAVSIGAGGYGGNLYFIPEPSTNAGYYRISYDAGLTESNIVATVNAGTNELRKYLFDDPIGITIIDGGMWVASFRAGVDKSAGSSRLMMTVFMYQSNGTERVLFSASSDEIDNKELTFVKKETTQPVFEVNANDRLGVIISAIATVPAVTFTTTVGDGNGSYFTTPLRIRHTQLRDYNGDVDYQHITTGQVAKLDYISDNGIIRINDSAQPSRYFLEVVNSTGTVYEVSGPFTNLMVTLSDDFEETATHTRPAWTNNVFPFTESQWVGGVSENTEGNADYYYIESSAGTTVIWSDTTETLPASLTLLSGYGGGTATVSVGNIYYTTNVFAHFTTEAELEAAKAACGVVLTNTVNEAVSNLTADISASTNALIPYTRTVYGDVTTTNEAGYAAFNATNAAVASYSALIPSSAVGSFTNIFRYNFNGVRKFGTLTNTAWFVKSGFGAGYKAVSTVVSVKDAAGNVLASSASQPVNIDLTVTTQAAITNTLAIPLNIYSGTVEIACIAVSTNASFSVSLCTGGQYVSSLSFGEAPIPYATVSDVSGLRLGGATNITDGVTSGTFIESTRTFDISAITGKAITNNQVNASVQSLSVSNSAGRAKITVDDTTVGTRFDTSLGFIWSVNNANLFVANSARIMLYTGYEIGFGSGAKSRIWYGWDGHLHINPRASGSGDLIIDDGNLTVAGTNTASVVSSQGPVLLGPSIGGKQAKLFSNGTNLWFVNVNSVTNAITTN